MAHRLSVLVLASFVATPALAQTPPVSTGRCTGVLCDLYYSNRPPPPPALPGQPPVPEPPDPTHLPCHDFLCAAFGGRTPDAPPPPPEPVAAPEPTKLVKAAKRKHRVTKTVASADASKPDAPK